LALSLGPNPILLEDNMSRLSTRIASGVLATGAAAAFALAAAGAANAGPPVSQGLAPGGGLVCSQPEYATFQVRGDGSATVDGAKFKLVRNGGVIANTPTRVNNYTIELRSAYGNFPGPGYYSLCATNTGTRNTLATVQIRTDYEF
jgi:hypothetical protein